MSILYILLSEMWAYSYYATLVQCTNTCKTYEFTFIILPGDKKKKTMQFSSVISDIFDGRILSSVQCLTCETVRDIPSKCAWEERVASELKSWRRGVGVSDKFELYGGGGRGNE